MPSFTTMTVYGANGGRATTAAGAGDNGGVAGNHQQTIVDYEPSAGTVYSTSFLPATASTTYTSTIAVASDAASGFIEVYAASGGTVTTTLTSGTTDGVTTLAEAQGTASGTIEDIIAEPTYTYTTYIASNAQGYSSTYNASGTTPGSVLYGSPSAGVSGS